MSDVVRLRGTLLLAIAAGCGGKIIDEPSALVEVPPPVDASVDAGVDARVEPDVLAPTCFTPAELRDHAVRWQCGPNAKASAAPAPQFDGNGCMDMAALGADHCCVSDDGHSCFRYYVESGATFDGARCCYVIAGMTGSATGRPLFVQGERRVARTKRTREWVAFIASDVATLEERTREALARAWLEDARLEHASVASFARFTLDLLALGAPPDLVAGAQRAALDEIEHARACFALAARYAREPIGPDRLDVDGALAPTSLADAAVATVREGCVGETIAAHLARAQLRGATDPNVRRVLARIASDEETHAALAWRFVAWAIAESRRAGCSIAGEIAATFAAEARRLLDVRYAEPDVDRDAWRAHGRLDGAETASEIALVLNEIVDPCLQALLASSITDRRPEAEGACHCTSS
jgi:hypothetical protein